MGKLFPLVNKEFHTNAYYVISSLNWCSFAENLGKFQNLFKFLPGSSNGGYHGGQVTLSSSLKTPEDRTKAVGEVVKNLGEQLIPGIRNEVTA